MVMYADEFQTKKKKKLTNIKNWLQQLRYYLRKVTIFSKSV